MQLQSYNEPQGFSLLSYLNPSKMTELYLNMASVDELKNLTTFVNLVKI
jgi:hypothetical protein